MPIHIDVSGTSYVLPLNGDPINVDGSEVRYLGYADPDGADEYRNTNAMSLSELRRKQILNLIPAAPQFTTIQSLSELLPMISDETIRKVLVDLEKHGMVRSTRPKSTRRGRMSRRWMINI